MDVLDQARREFPPTVSIALAVNLIRAGYPDAAAVAQAPDADLLWRVPYLGPKRLVGLRAQLRAQRLAQMPPGGAERPWEAVPGLLLGSTTPQP